MPCRVAWAGGGEGECGFKNNLQGRASSQAAVGAVASEVRGSYISYLPLLIVAHCAWSPGAGSLRGGVRGTDAGCEHEQCPQILRQSQRCLRQVFSRVAMQTTYFHAIDLTRSPHY